MKCALILLAIISLMLIAVLVYDLRVCAMLSDWRGFFTDSLILGIVGGGWAGLIHAIIREIQWQRFHDEEE